MLDVFSGSAFNTIELTAAINKQPFVPGRIGALGIFEERGVATTSVMIDEKDGVLSLVQSQPRGAPAEQIQRESRRARSIAIPSLPLEDRITADEVQGVRAFGLEDETELVNQVVNERMEIGARNLDSTLEWHRIGAIKGQVLDADSSVLVDLFAEFNVVAQIEIDFDLDNAAPLSGAVRKQCHLVARTIEDELGAAQHTGIVGIVGSAFMDDLVSHPEVLAAYERWQAASAAAGASAQPGDFLRMGLARRSFVYAGILFEEYRGKVGATDFVGADKAHFFPVGVQGLFLTRFGPADFVEAINTIGLPRYAKVAPDMRFQRYIDLHMQTNPLNLCTRPRVLVPGRRT